MQVKCSERCHLLFNGSQDLGHQALESIIALPPAAQQEYIQRQEQIQQHGSDSEQLYGIKIAILKAINNALFHLRASSAAAKLEKLQIIKGLIYKSKEIGQCEDWLYLARRVVQHNMGIFHYRFKNNYSKDYHPSDFIEVEYLLEHHNGNKTPKMYGIDLTFKNFHKVMVAEVRTRKTS